MSIRLKPGKEKSVQRGHPWIFSGAVAASAGAPGDLLEVLSPKGDRLGWALYNPNSQIVGRLVSSGPKPLAEDWLTERVLAAFARRNDLLTDATTAVRRIHGEADELPGLVCDQYGDAAVLQINAYGFETRQAELLAALRTAGVKAAYLRGDSEARKREGLPAQSAPLFGDIDWAAIEIRENGLRYAVDVAGGHKTGFYLDQRDNRALVRRLAAGKRVLNLCAYTGGFTVSAAAGGAASWTSVDISADAVAAGKANLGRNGFAEGEWVTADLFQYLREKGPRCELVVLDPPAFAKSKPEVERAARGYKDVNRLALQRTEVGGYMLTFSCSHHMDLDLFQKVVFSAAEEANVSAQVVQRLGAGPDHPFHLRHPEGEYLKGFLLRRIR
jgi:23S rRNA (cytosine1962-C5)-methyltransferase